MPFYGSVQTFVQGVQKIELLEKKKIIIQPNLNTTLKVSKIIKREKKNEAYRKC